jgi:FMN phosphatase YigB (HAD superfamily)
MIGDDHAADVVGAHEAGWRSVHFDPDGNHPSDTPSTATVSDLRELLAILH